MALNLFGPPTKDDIKVAYIDPILGLVEGVSICEANEYAKKEPGTTFIFRNGDQTLQYLNVNEINSLDPNVLTATDKCGGISQKKECGPPTIQIFGGGGIGAAGNPIVGNDGSILAVDIIRGGNGYQYPPLASAKDVCNYGSGATFTTVIGEVVEKTETYDNEADFEDYELCEPTDVGYGKRYGPDGEDLGPWDPKVYTEPGEDPIRKEIEEFEKIVRRLARAPFWNTRTAKPTKITCSDTSVIPSKYDVTDATFLQKQRNDGVKNPVGWNEFMNTYAISPKPPSNVKGSDFAGRVFTFEWTEDFPIDGEYIFRGLCDNKAQLYIDNLKLADLGSFRGPVKAIQKTITKGIHNIRVDLLNVPINSTSTSTSTSQAKTADVDFGYRTVSSSTLASYFRIPELGIDIYKPTRTALNQNIPKKVEVGKVYVIEFEVPSTRGSVSISINGKSLIVEDLKSKSARDLFLTINRGRFFDVQNGKTKATCKFVVDGQGGIEPPSNVISPKSWNENPMGVSLTIDAPEPTVPKEPVPEQEGRCPNNPIWTTRFPGAKENWYPVNSYGTEDPQAWSKFMNRYAMSPVKPLDTPGSDTSGTTFANSWDIDIPYDGFYGIQGTRDNRGTIYIDGNKVSDLDNYNTENPNIQKVFIAKGRHTIGVEVFNTPKNTITTVNQKIFRTKDWQVEATKVVQITADVDFGYRTVSSSTLASYFRIPELGIDVYKPVRTALNQNIPKKVEVGKVYTIEFEVPSTRGSVSININGKSLIVEDLKSKSARDLFLTINRGRFFDVQNGKTKATCKFVVDENEANSNLVGLSGGTAKDGVTYEGPPLFAYKDNRWNDFMNNHSVSPIIPGPPPDADGRKKFAWKNVKFPESGQYDIVFLSDSAGILFIGGREVLRSQRFSENPQIFKVNITQGTYNVVVTTDYPYSTPQTNDAKYFREQNPTGFGIVIRKDVKVVTQVTSWKRNPTAVSAILIPPPCPRRIRGKGIVTDIIVNDPGNGYLPPLLPSTIPPSTLAPIQTNVPGVPGAGAAAGAGGVGGVPSVPVAATPLPIPSPPSGAPTGINARFIPQFEVVRDPVVVDPQKLLQVTDLVGLKQTGYVNGRAYYGAVYYDKGIRYAGFYETAGEPVRVYDTLRESILAQVTTPPSAILRQGTDIRSNDPLLNIPGTVQSTLNSNSIVGAGDISTPSVPFVQEPLQDPIYPVSLRLKRVLVEDPGINYNVTDQIRVIPSNGAVLEPVFGSFGRVIKVAVIDPGFGFTEYPRIEMFTPL